MKNIHDQITKNFNAYEGRCLGEDCCGNSSPVSHDMWYTLQRFRDSMCDLYGRDIRFDLSNGFRCQTHNKSIKNSSRTSQHCKGLAVDIYIPEGVNPTIFNEEAKKFFNGVGIYSTFLHVDLRIGRRVSWRG